MAEDWIKLEKNAEYRVIAGGLRGKEGRCLEIREGHFGRSWGRIGLGVQTSTWIRASHLAPAVSEDKRYKVHQGS